MQYLARFELEKGAILQGIVHFPGKPRGGVYYGDDSFELVERLAQAYSAVPGCEISIRASLRAGQLAQTLLFHAPLGAEEAFRHYLADICNSERWWRIPSNSHSIEPPTICAPKYGRLTWHDSNRSAMSAMPPGWWLIFGPRCPA